MQRTVSGTRTKKNGKMEKWKNDTWIKPFRNVIYRYSGVPSDQLTQTLGSPVALPSVSRICGMIAVD
jgi:hypothetical protein